MDLFSKQNIKKLVSPSKKLGQNFLIDRKIAEKLIESADLNKKDIVLEIGPGIGNITEKLAEKAKKVIAVEKDPGMIKFLQGKNIQAVNEDILKFKDFPKKYKIVANLPFYLTAPVIRKLLEGNQPQSMSLMIQKEVAQRINANPPKMSILAVSVQLYARTKIISYVSKRHFWPCPKVDSAIIKIVPEPIKDIPIDLFFKIVKSGFSHPRKQLINNLSNRFGSKEKVGKWLLMNNIKPIQRAETLSIEDWINLTKTIKIY